jgi:hypothetical protein
MHLPRARAVLLTALLIGGAVASGATSASASPNGFWLIEQATASDGSQLLGGTGAATLSANSQWLAFGRLDGSGAYVKSLLSGAVTRVSLNPSGAPANAPASPVGISTDGRLVAFETAATNMGLGPATANDIYVRDRMTKTTYRANVLPGGSTPVAAKAGQAAYADNGNSLAFATSTNRILLWVIAEKATEWVDISTASVAGNGGSSEPAIAANGRYITFTSTSSNLVANDTNFVADVFVRDIVAKVTVRASIAQGGAQLNLASGQSSISVDARYVAFASAATNAVSGDTNTDQDVFRRDMKLQATIRLSLSGSKQVFGSSGHPDISNDGSIVAYDSISDDLDPPGAPKGQTNIFRADVAAITGGPADINGGHVPNKGTSLPVLDALGKEIAFTSSSTNLVQTDTNGAPDAFVTHTAELGPLSIPEDFATRQVADFQASMDTDAATYALYIGTTTPTHLIVSLAHAPVWAAHREPVARLYEAFFHREPDLGGWNYWTKKHVSGVRLAKIATMFAKSSEFATAYGKTSNTQFVNLVYGNVLQRKPDPAGLAHWVAKLDGGLPRGDLMVQFSESSEGKRTLAPEVDASLIGLGMFGKMPSADLYVNAAAAAHAFGEPEWVALTYLRSVAYDAVIQP